MLEAYKEKLETRRKYLSNRIRFLETLPENRLSRKYSCTFPNTLPYRVTFREMTDINDILFDINNYLDRYICDVCLICNKIIGHDPHERHHISYYPETIILVHTKCHLRIHHSDSFPYLKPPTGDSRDFYNGIKKPDNFIESGILGGELKSVYSTRASVYPRPNLNWNRAAISENNINYGVIHRKIK